MVETVRKFFKLKHFRVKLENIRSDVQDVEIYLNKFSDDFFFWKEIADELSEENKALLIGDFNGIEDGLGNDILGDPEDFAESLSNLEPCMKRALAEKIHAYEVSESDVSYCR